MWNGSVGWGWGGSLGPGCKNVNDIIVESTLTGLSSHYVWLQKIFSLAAKTAFTRVVRPLTRLWSVCFWEFVRSGFWQASSTPISSKHSFVGLALCTVGSTPFSRVPLDPILSKASSDLYDTIDLHLAPYWNQMTSENIHSSYKTRPSSAVWHFFLNKINSTLMRLSMFNFPLSSRIKPSSSLPLMHFPVSPPFQTLKRLSSNPIRMRSNDKKLLNHVLIFFLISSQSVAVDLHPC